ncbi:MAG TPA: hypothetical protein VMF51_04210 [Nocardioides sp.]|uniref:hypothetical protein n=1 Tax=Nocardioides sp. TaxID=35761 RepID=UPI002B9C68D4|nr:hypothetical protein [Nocardioides sp.]HTW14309.1 hypothetical protein [Nocardioides sp.]
MAGEGKRAGSRRAARPRPTFRPRLLLLAVGVTLAVVAWGYLVYAAIDFGSSARSGDGGAWAFLALASVGAIACLFLGLMMIARLLRSLGITTPPPSAAPAVDTADELGPGTPPAPRAPGGRRAAR